MKMKLWNHTVCSYIKFIPTVLKNSKKISFISHLFVDCQTLESNIVKFGL